ncbi:MAG: ATP-binding protein, partial [Solirubrobacteraceae bacterium]
PDDRRRAELARALEQAGLSVREARGLAEARSQSPGTDVAVVAIDAPGGLELVSELHSGTTTATVSILARSAVALDSDAAVRVLDAGADGYVPDGGPRELLVATVRSLARRGAAARAAASARTRLAAGIDAVPIGVLLLDERLSVIGTNRQLRQMGLLAADPQHRDVAGAVPGPAGDHLARLARSVHETRREQSERFVTGPEADPRYWQARAHVVARASAGVDGIGITIEDITELEQTLERLRVSQQRWRAVFDSDQLGVCLRDVSNRVIECNEAYAHIFDAPDAASLVGTDVTELLAPEDAAEVSAGYPERWAVQPGRSLRIDQDHTLVSGRRISIRATNTVVRDASGAALYHLSMVESRTEQKQLEAALDRTRRTEAIGRLAGGVAHDVNNMLAVIIGYTEIASRRLGDDHELQEELGEISRAAEHSRSLARDLLAFGRQQVLDRQPLAPGEVVAGLSKLLGHTMSEAIRLTIRDDSAGAIVLGDRAQLETVIINLVANARDAMPDGGRITIRTAVTRSTPAVAGRVTISVTDTGDGMTDEVRENIFEPFYTTKALGQGTGLGLATVAGIIDQLGGEISVESSLGAGSTFTVSLPRESDQAGDAIGDDEAMASEPEAPGKTVLVVEDEVQVRTLVERLLELAGYQALSAASGAEALELLRAGDRPVDLLLTDMILPDLLGGELARTALELIPGLRVVYTSGYAGSTVVRDGMPQGDGFLAKPYGSDDLRRVIDAAFAADA